MDYEMMKGALIAMGLDRADVDEYFRLSENLVIPAGGDISRQIAVVAGVGNNLVELAGYFGQDEYGILTINAAMLFSIGYRAGQAAEELN